MSRVTGPTCLFKNNKCEARVFTCKMRIIEDLNFREINYLKDPMTSAWDLVRLNVTMVVILILNKFK